MNPEFNEMLEKMSVSELEDCVKHIQRRVKERGDEMIEKNIAPYLSYEYAKFEPSVAYVYDFMESYSTKLMKGKLVLDREKLEENFEVKDVFEVESIVEGYRSDPPFVSKVKTNEYELRTKDGEKEVFTISVERILKKVTITLRDFVINYLFLFEDSVNIKIKKDSEVVYKRAIENACQSDRIEKYIKEQVYTTIQENRFEVSYYDVDVCESEDTDSIKDLYISHCFSQIVSPSQTHWGDTMKANETYHFDFNLFDLPNANQKLYIEACWKEVADIVRVKYEDLLGDENILTSSEGGGCFCFYDMDITVPRRGLEFKLNYLDDNDMPKKMGDITIWDNSYFRTNTLPETVSSQLLEALKAEE